MIPLIQSTVFVAYVGYVWKKFGVLPSISDSWYALENRSPLFTFFIWAIALPMCFTNNVWYFGAGVFLCFTGAAADFKESMTDKVHGVGAVGGITLALAGLASQGILWPFIVVIVASLLLKYLKVNNQTWWVEIVAFVTIEIGLII